MSVPPRRAARSETEAILRGRLLGKPVELLDGRRGVLASVWFDPAVRALACCVSIEGASVWVDASEVRIPPGRGA